MLPPRRRQQPLCESLLRPKLAVALGCRGTGMEMRSIGAKRMIRAHLRPRTDPVIAIQVPLTAHHPCTLQPASVCQVLLTIAR